MEHQGLTGHRVRPDLPAVGVCLATPADLAPTACLGRTVKTELPAYPDLRDRREKMARTVRRALRGCQAPRVRQGRLDQGADSERKDLPVRPVLLDRQDLKVRMEQMVHRDLLDRLDLTGPQAL